MRRLTRCSSVMAVVPNRAGTGSARNRGGSERSERTNWPGSGAVSENLPRRHGDTEKIGPSDHRGHRPIGAAFCFPITRSPDLQITRSSVSLCLRGGFLQTAPLLVADSAEIPATPRAILPECLPASKCLRRYAVIGGTILSGPCKK